MQQFNTKDRPLLQLHTHRLFSERQQTELEVKDTRSLWLKVLVNCRSFPCQSDFDPPASQPDSLTQTNLHMRKV